MGLRVCRILTAFLICFPWVLAAQTEDPTTSRRVDAQNAGAGAEVVINQIDTSAYPKVTVFATVLKAGEPVIGLADKDFRVREDEVDQEPLTVVPRLTPLNAVITLDTSGSIKKALPDVQKAAKSFIDILQEQDRFQVIGFARQVTQLSTTGDRAAARAAIDSAVARGDTALYDAIYQSIDVLSDKAGRKAIVLLTDGVDDNGQGGQLSRHSVQDALALARKVNVPIFVIGLGPEKDQKILAQIAGETGGRYFDAPTAEQLKEIYDSIGKQLSGQYNIFYTSNLPADGAVHRIALNYGAMRGAKEFTAPGTLAVVNKTIVAPAVSTVVTVTTENDKPAAATPTATPGVTTVTVSKTLVISSLPGLHIAALMTEGGEPVAFDHAELLTKPASAFEDQKRLEYCSGNEKKCTFNVPSGTYLVRIERGAVKAEREVEVDAAKANNYFIVLNAGVLNAIVVPKENGAPIRFDRLEVVRGAADAFSESKELDNCGGVEKCSFTVPAGSYELRARKGTVTAAQNVEVPAGQVVNVSILLSAAMLNLGATLKEGGSLVRFDRMDVLLPSENSFEEPKSLDNCGGTEKCSFIVPPGKYTVAARFGEAKVKKEIEVTANQANNVVLTLNAGVLNVMATLNGAPTVVERIEVFPKIEDGAEPPRRIDDCGGSNKCTFKLPQGNYSVVATKNKSKVAKDIELQAGQTVVLEIQLQLQQEKSGGPVS